MGGGKKANNFNEEKAHIAPKRLFLIFSKTLFKNFYIIKVYVRQIEYIYLSMHYKQLL